MRRTGIGLLVGALAAASILAAGQRPASSDSGQAPGPTVHIEDVERFYKIYDGAGGQPTAEQLQRYLDEGSDGLRHFAKARNTTGTRIAEALAKQPAMYSDARRCMAVLPRVRERLEVVLTTLVRLYPEARRPAVTIAVGRGRPVAIGYPDTGVQIGLEALCATNWMNPNVEDRFVYVIAHEYAHVQQSPALVDEERPTVLQRSLLEGVADLTGELIAGKVAYSYFDDLTRGREVDIETAFAADVDKTDLRDWVDNTTAEKPNDLGYWVGYRIAKTYYQRATDKRAALREMLEATDAKAFLAKSGWRPGLPQQ